MSLRQEIETAPRTVTTVEATDESYTDAIRVLARYFLEVLDTIQVEYPGDSASDLGDALYHACRSKLPQELRDELSGGQVAMAAHLAYQAHIADPPAQEEA